MCHFSARPQGGKAQSRLVRGTVTFAAALTPCTRDRTEVNGQAKPKDDKTQLPTHGAAVLPSVRVDSYKSRVRRDPFPGDKASKGAFAEILDKWRKVLKEGDEDPLGDKPTDEVSRRNSRKC